MRVFVYEFVTGGGWHGQARERPPDSLLDEGRAMRAALALDFAAIGGCAVDVLDDVRWGGFDPHPAIAVHRVASAADERRALVRLARAADWTVTVAPEFDGHLSERVRLVEQCGGRLLGPPSATVALTSDKHATALHLARRGVAVPRGLLLESGEPLPVDFSYPAVLKPRDGAGSLGVRWLAGALGERASVPARLEAYCAGTSASVACLCGPRGVAPLAPCAQRLAGPRDFAYLGGSLPLAPLLARRAQALAARAVASLPSALGYLGVDLVLGSDPAGGDDFVIEINPRLTTSYVGLRAFSRVNLAAAMIAVARGRDAELCWNEGTIEFNSAGTIRQKAAP